MNKALKLILVITLISFFSQSCRKGGPFGIKGKGENVTEIKNLTGFDKIHLSIDADIYYTQDSVYKVEITAQQNILAVLKVEVQNNTLTFDYKRNVWDHKKVKITVHSPNMNELSISGSGDIIAQNLLTTNTLELSISGSGNVNIPALNAKSLKATTSGTGDVKISGGSVTGETLNISGTGNIDNEKLQTESATVKISGLGNVTVNVTETLDVNISGSGDVRYKGKPTVKSSISGTGKLVHLD